MLRELPIRKPCPSQVVLSDSAISALRVAATHVNGNLYLISYTPRLKWLKSITA